MTIADVSSTVTHVGNGVTTLWPYTFYIPNDTAAHVGLFSIDSGVLTTLDATLYSITGIDDDNGGEVTYPLTGEPISSEFRLVIWRDVGYTQGLELTNQSQYYPKDLENALDLTVMQVQQLRDESSRSIKVTLGSTLTPDEFIADLQEGAAEAAASATAAAESATAAAASEDLIAPLADDIVAIVVISDDITTVAANITDIQNAEENADRAEAAASGLPFFTTSTEAPEVEDGANGDIWYQVDA